MNWKTIGGLAVCIVSGIAAFASELKDQQQEKKIEELESRLSKIEDERD